MTDVKPDSNDLFATHPEAMDFTSGHRIVPLIGGHDTFSMIEKAINDAKKTVHMAYWALEPGMKTTSKIEPKTLAELLRDTVRRGVELRIVIADFDPVIGSVFHAGAWKSYRNLMAIGDGLKKEEAARLSIMCSRHDTRWGPIARTAAQPILKLQLAKKVAELNALKTKKARTEMLQNMPGLWPFITFGDKGVASRVDAFPGFYPAAHHEKLCVIDDRIVFLGGLDITEKRKDDWDHENEFPWHDVACRLEGPVAAFFASHFRSRWNEERLEFLKFLEASKPPASIKALPDRHNVTELATDVPERKPLKDGVEVKPLRTLSKQSRSWFSRSPRTQITEIREAYLKIIGGAEKFLYVENQYLRSTAIAEALAERAEKRKALEMILILPLMAEDAFVEEEPNIATRHGQYLQEKNTNIIQEAFGDRLGIFTMQMPRQKKLPDPEKADAEDIIENTVYIHAKTLICDDRIAIIGSANLNDRSLQTDTETAIAWRGDPQVRDYRIALWKHALDIDTSSWKGKFLDKWNAIAKSNASDDPDERSGFAVPFPDRHLDAHAKRSWLVPDELV